MAGIAGILLTAPLSLQRLVGPIPQLGYALTAGGAALALRCCLWAWRPSSTVTVVATFVCMVFATVTVVVGAGQVATGLGATDSQLLCADDVSPAIVAGGQEVLHGSNPFTAYDVVHAEQSLGCTSFHVTALRGGIFAAADGPSRPSASLTQRPGRRSTAMLPTASCSASTIRAGARSPASRVRTAWWC